MPSQSPSLAALQDFLETPLDAVLDRHMHADPAEAMVQLFHQMARDVPAYAARLAAHGIEPAMIQAPADLARLPLLDKPGYINAYPLAERCWHGTFASCDFVAMSSGSTGKPTGWARRTVDELAIARRFEQVFYDTFRADERRTLAVVCFALGTWVGGMYTTSCVRHLAAKGYPITLVTPGNNRAEILRVVQELAPQFEQTILLGYPPFLKDVIDTGRAQHVPWAQYRIGLVTAGEVFSEEWRALVGERTGMEDACYGSAALYGTADAGVLANETPLSICIRRWLAEHPAVAQTLFGEPRLPTLCQYDPHSRYFEAHDRTLIFSGDNGVPLMRYNILDTGGIISYDAMISTLATHGFDPVAALGPNARGVRPLPFVFVFGRSDFTVSYYGANIYPENVTVGLEAAEIRDWVTGKFVLYVQEDADQARALAVAIELAADQSSSAERVALAEQAITRELLRLNSEFGAYVPIERRTPQVTLLPHGDAQWFPLGVKHRYTKK